MDMSPRYHHSIIGGTFDRFHAGHIYFLEIAFANSRYVTIGITTRKLTMKKVLPHVIQEFSFRKRSVQNYLRERGFTNRSDIIPLQDVFGNALSIRHIDAIFTTSAGMRNSHLINAKRKAKDFPPLKINKIPLQKGEDGKIISSSRIRLGEIDKTGRPFTSLFKNFKELVIPNNLRDGLLLPFGKIAKGNFPSVNSQKFIIAVGDITVAEFVRRGIVPHVSVYDFYNRRQKIEDKKILKSLPRATKKLVNRNGSINCKTAIEIQNVIISSIRSDKRKAINIIGEEDLIALPSMLFAPLNGIVCYGVSDKGMAVVEIDDGLKERLETNYLQKFIRV